MTAVPQRVVIAGGGFASLQDATVAQDRSTLLASQNGPFSARLASAIPLLGIAHRSM